MHLMFKYQLVSSKIFEWHVKAMKEKVTQVPKSLKALP